MNAPSPSRESHLVDPVHFFNSCGVSLLTLRDQSQTIEAQANEIVKLRRQLKTALERSGGKSGNDE